MKNKYIALISTIFLVALFLAIIIFNRTSAFNEKQIIGEEAARKSNYTVDTEIIGNTYKTNAICSFEYSDIFIGKDMNTNGLMYKVIDPPECEKGEKVILVLDDMNTEEIYDDKVVAIEFPNN